MLALPGVSNSNMSTEIRRAYGPGRVRSRVSSFFLLFFSSPLTPPLGFRRPKHEGQNVAGLLVAPLGAPFGAPGPSCSFRWVPSLRFCLSLPRFDASVVDRVCQKASKAPFDTAKPQFSQHKTTIFENPTFWCILQFLLFLVRFGVSVGPLGDSLGPPWAPEGPSGGPFWDHFARPSLTQGYFWVSFSLLDLF